MNPTREKPQEINYVASLFLWFLGMSSTVNMLEWCERENEEEDYFTGNDPKIVMALRQCGLLKLFKI
jgi:hypothetical protein